MSIIEDDISLRTGRAVKRQREAAGLSLRMLAARSGVSPSMISDIERGTKSPTVTTIVRIAQALGVTAADLIDAGAEAGSRIRILRRGEGAVGDHPAPWESLGPAGPGSRIDFVRIHIPPATVLGPSAAHAPPARSVSAWVTKRRSLRPATAAPAAPMSRTASRTRTHPLRR